MELVAVDLLVRGVVHQLEQTLQFVVPQVHLSFLLIPAEIESSS